MCGPVENDSEVKQISDELEFIESDEETDDEDSEDDEETDDSRTVILFNGLMQPDEGVSRLLTRHPPNDENSEDEEETDDSPRIMSGVNEFVSRLSTRNDNTPTIEIGIPDAERGEATTSQWRAFMEELSSRIVAPLLRMGQTSLLAISTPDDNDNYYANLREILSEQRTSSQSN